MLAIVCTQAYRCYLNLRSKDMAAGDEAFPEHGVDIEEARREMYQELLDQSGWRFIQDQSPQGLFKVFWRHEGHYRLSPDETAICLGIPMSAVDEFRSQAGESSDGSQDFVHKIHTDPTSGQVSIGFDGPADESYYNFLNRVIELGKDLNEQQEDELGETDTRIARQISLSDSYRSEAADILLIPNNATNRLLRQFERAGEPDGTLSMMKSAGISKEDAIAGITHRRRQIDDFHAGPMEPYQRFDIEIHPFTKFVGSVQLD